MQKIRWIKVRSPSHFATFLVAIRYVRISASITIQETAGGLDEKILRGRRTGGSLPRQGTCCMFALMRIIG